MEINLHNVAVRFIKYADYAEAYRRYAVFELGRVSKDELERLEKAYTQPPFKICDDPTNGVVQKSEALAERLYSVRLCLFIGNICDGANLIEETHDNSNITVTCTPGNIRPTLKSIKHGVSKKSWFERHPIDWDRCVKEKKEEIETNTTTVFEVRGIVVCNRGSSCLQIARLDAGELERLEAFAGEYGSKLNKVCNTGFG